MSVASAPSERYRQRVEFMKSMAGPGYGGKPDREPEPKDDFSWKKFFHMVYCFFKEKIAHQKCKRQEKDIHGHR